MDFTELGMVMLSRPLSRKAEFPMLSSADDNVTLFKLGQLAKDKKPMLVTVLGRVICLKLSQERKALFKMLTSPRDIVTLSRLVHRSNA